MLFNSFDFLLFFILFFITFYYLNGLYRKYILLIASCIFYMWFIPSYILILFLTILIDYFAGIYIERDKTQKLKKIHLIIGIVNTCLVLSIFKYFNFFVDNLNYIGFKTIKHWNIILPIGLSFHVFQSLSYVIEVYRGNLKAEKNLLTYANFVMMFPQLVAGPIERASNLLPQLKKCDHKILTSDMSIGFSRIIWGLFKKVVIADNISNYVDATYNNYYFHNGSTLLLATFLFAIEIYCDFSGYSDMAIGIARMLGFRFKENFNLPYFSKSITEFWRRWHISLSSWLRDYLYISMGGSKVNKFITYRNLILTMLIGGFWHGASWNFIIWGGLNGIFLSIEKMINFKKPSNLIYKFTSLVYVYISISFTWIFFRSETFNQAKSIIKKIFTNFQIKNLYFFDPNIFISFLFSIFIMIFFEILIFRKYNFDTLYNKFGTLKIHIFSLFILILIFLFGNRFGTQFIYFQF